ncbi:MAG: HAMP domain-containing sensor histidine kinase [Gammaproteobacteria bacterium]|nr:HAMP domain-containing sensor histidine kinase [Gammaproteobacteria bacterium]
MATASPPALHHDDEAADAPKAPGARVVGLRHRLALALLGLTLTAAAIQGLCFLALEYWIERDSLISMLDRELDYMVETGAAPSTEPPGVGNLRQRYYRTGQTAQLNPAIAALGPGLHDDVLIAGVHYLVLVQELSEDRGRAYIVYDSRRLQGRGQRQLISLVIGLAVVLVIALWGARRLTRAALQPLAGLVGQIRRLDPEQRGRSLVAVDDPDLTVISDALNTYMARFEAVVERERAFSSAASHELRTPLSVIRGAVELLEAGAPDPTRPLARIRRAVAQAQADLDALLALSRLRESPTSRELALDTLLPEWAELDNTTTTRLAWRLAPTRLIASPGSVHVIFSNLLRNAVRAAGPNGEVIIELAGPVLRVIDNGPGVPVGELPLVFEPHFRGRDGGTGIGLYVARTLARRHGWDLRLVNRASGGAVAELRF